MRLSLEEIAIRRGGFSLRASGTFEEGVHLVSGRVGSGKSTLALAIAGCLAPDSGRIRRVEIGSMLLCLQFPEHQVTGRTVEEEITSWGAAPARVLASMNPEFAEFAGDRNPLRISRGELKQLLLLAALDRDPDLLLFDEPLSSLDCAARSRFFSLLEERRRGITVLFTHSTGPLPRVDWLWETGGGILRFLGSPPDAIGAWSCPPGYIRVLLERGIVPENISLRDAREASCRI